MSDRDRLKAMVRHFVYLFLAGLMAYWTIGYVRDGRDGMAALGVVLTAAWLREAFRADPT